MPALPLAHVEDAQKLQSDGLVELYEIVPAIGAGTFRFKSDSDIDWRGNTYTGMPLSMSGQGVTADNGHAAMRLLIGSPDLDLAMFKPLIYDGSLDGGTLTRLRVLLDDVLDNQLVREVTVWEIQQVVNYTRSQLTLQLGLASDGIGFVIPHRQYIAPDFQSVLLR